MSRQLEALASRGARLLLVFTGGLEPRYNYRNQFFEAFPDLDFKGWVELQYLADANHTFSREIFQHRLEECVIRWFRKHMNTIDRTLVSPATSNDPGPDEDPVETAYRSAK